PGATRTPYGASRDRNAICRCGMSAYTTSAVVTKVSTGTITGINNMVVVTSSPRPRCPPPGGSSRSARSVLRSTSNGPCAASDLDIDDLANDEEPDDLERDRRREQHPSHVRSEQQVQVRRID